jgi:FkbM family methyltransferase
MAHFSKRGLQSLRSLLGRDGARTPSDPWEHLDLTHTFESGVTVSIRGQSDWYVFNEVFSEGGYDAAIDLLSARVGTDTDPLVLDLGANVGFFAARVVDRLIRSRTNEPVALVLVEGSPAVYRDLESRINGWSKGGFSISAINGLVGRRDGAGTISEVDFGARNTMIPSHNAGISPVSEMTHHEIPFVDLSEVVGKRRIALLKCDIEGSEQNFLENYGADLLPATDLAVFEFHHDLCDVPRCLEILSRAGLGVVSSTDQRDETSLVLLERKTG